MATEPARKLLLVSLLLAMASELAKEQLLLLPALFTRLLCRRTHLCILHAVRISDSSALTPLAQFVKNTAETMTVEQGNI